MLFFYLKKLENEGGKMYYKKIANDILKLVGGQENVTSLTHCFTRLRFYLKDSSKADKEKLLETEGVISVVESGGQYQVVLGSKVEEIYQAIEPLLGSESTITTEKESVSIGNKILNTVAAIFTPTVPAIAASGMLKGILAVAVLIADSYYQVDLKTFQTYIILNAASDALFYFMPIILGYSAAKVFKTNEFIAMVIGATLCYPAIVELMTSDASVSLFSIQLTKASYTSSVIPIIISVFVLSYVQRFLDKYIPEVLKIIMVPTFSLLIMVPATLIVFGPIGIYLGEFVNWLYYYIMNFSPILLGAFIGGIWCVLVIFGAHRAIIPIGINDVAQTGRQNLLAFAGAANFSQAGASFGVFLKTKNKELKTVAASATVTALFGITEPAIYGTNLRLKKPMIYAVISGALGGALMGWGGSYGTAFANQGVLTIPVYADAGAKAFICYLLGISIAFFGACIMTVVLGFKDLEATETSKELAKDIDLISPTTGELVPLTEVNDEVFASGAMGTGVGIASNTNKIIAPADGVVSVLTETRHAIGLTLDNGVEMLIHIGIDTVELKGKYFETHVTTGQRIKKGELLISFESDKIKESGFDSTVIVVITNTPNYSDISVTNESSINKSDTLLHLSSKEINHERV